MGKPKTVSIRYETQFFTILYVAETTYLLILYLDLRTMSKTARLTTSIGWGAATQAGNQDRRMAMIQSWKQRLIGGIALTTAIVLGSTMAATSVRADHARSWEGAVVGGVIGGLIGSTTGKRHDRLAAVSIAAVLGTLYGGQFTTHHRYHRPSHHQRQWQGQRVRQQPWYVHPQRYHERQWHQRVHQRPWYVHPQRHQQRQWHGQRVHQQPRYVHPQRHQHRQRHSQRVHQQPRYLHPQRHQHRHDHRW